VVDNNKRSVSLRIEFFTEEEVSYDSISDGQVKWEFEIENQRNDITRYGVGIIDPYAKKPEIKFHYLIVEEKLQ